MLPALLALLLSPAACAAELPAQRVAVLRFESDYGELGGIAASDLFAVFLRQNYPGVAVVERSSLEHLLPREQLQSHEAVVSSETAARLQGALGVDAIVIGSISDLKIEANSGAGAITMEVRMMQAGTDAVLWSDSRTVGVRPQEFLGLIGDPSESDAVVRGRLIEKAVFELVQDMGQRLSRAALDPGAASAAAVETAAANPLCESAQRRINELGDSIASDEGLYWAHRMREEPGVSVNPGLDYPDEALRQRLTIKILYWLGEKALPPVSEAQAARIAAAKKKIKSLFLACSSGTPTLGEENP